MPDFAALGIRVDTAGVATGTAELDQLAVSAQRAEDAAQGIGPAYAIAGQQVQASAAAARSSAVGFGVQATQMRAAGLSARQYSQAMRLLPAQITDIVTGLASGQSPFLVAIQQGGQLRDSFGGFGGALRAVGTLITPTRLAIGGLAGIGFALFQAYRQAQRENFELNKQIIISGNVAGVTAGQLAIMADSIDDIVGTRGAASETLAQLAASGRVAAEDLEQFTIAAQFMARAVDQPVEETVKILSELGRSPVEAATKLNERTNFLTESIYDQIVALEERGEVEAAAQVAQRAYMEEFLQRSRRIQDEQPALSAAASGIGGAFREMWDSITGAFLPEQPEERLRRLRELRGDRELFTGTGARLTGRDRERDLEEAALAAQIEGAQRRAEEKAEQARRIRLREQERAEREARIKAQRAIDDAVAASRAADIQRDLDDSLAQYSAYEAQLEAQRDAGLISLEDYYDERRRLIEQGIDAQVEALEAENRLLEAQRARVREQTRQDVAKSDPAERAKIEAEAQTKLIELDQKRLDNISKLSRLEGDRISQINVLADQETTAHQKIAASIEDARQAAESYLRTIQQAQQRELEGFGLGDRAREIGRDLSEIDERFENQRQQLRRDRRSGKIEEDQYERELEIINEFHRKALQSTEQYYDALEAREADFFLGAQEGLADYLDRSRNVAEQSAELFTNAFQGMEDALLDFVVNGKSNFKDFAESVLSDLLRIQLRAAVLQLFGGILGSGVNLNTAIAGTSNAGSLTVTQPAMTADTGIMRVPRDNQPFLLHKDEAVLPRSMNPWAGGRSPFGSGVTFNQTVNAGPGTDAAQMHAIAQQAKQEAINEITEMLYRGRIAGVSS